MRTGIMLALMATSATAQGLRDTDTELDIAALDDALSGRIIEFFDGSKSYYDPDGGYIYTYANNGTAPTVSGPMAGSALISKSADRAATPSCWQTTGLS